MRLMRLATNYPRYLSQFYKQRVGLEDEPYEVQYQTLMADCFGWADFWTYALCKSGYEVWEPVGNAGPMQKVWAREHDISYSQTEWIIDILMAQVKHFQPDLLFVSDYITYSAEFLRCLRHECPSIRLVIGWCGAPYPDKSVFHAYDLVLSNMPGLVAHFRENGHKSEYLLHGFEPRILEKLDRQSETRTAFSFIGSIVKRTDFHNTREQLLIKLVRATALQIWSGSTASSSQIPRLLKLKQALYDLVHTLKLFPGGKNLLASVPYIKKYLNMTYRPEPTGILDSAILSRCHEPVYGLAMYQKLYGSDITLNTHIDISLQYASNMRLYEATGVGTCLLTEWQPNLHEIFEPELEVVTYRNAEEAREKVRYLLSHDRKRREIGKAGQLRTLQHHTLECRAQTFDRFIQEALS